MTKSVTRNAGPKELTQIEILRYEISLLLLGVGLMKAWVRTGCVATMSIRGWNLAKPIPPIPIDNSRMQYKVREITW